MNRPPRNPQKKMLSLNILIKSCVQGLVIFAASFGSYFYLLGQNPDNASIARAMALAIIMIANLFLVLTISSKHDSILATFKKMVKDKIMWAINFGTIGGLLLILYTPLNSFLKLAPLSFGQLLSAAGIAAISVLWYELVKLYYRREKKISV